ncbi:MAG: hypothetical protein MUE44_07980 [Oscillatoriaceae cyanobacterium Prado104]|nr:hypothetical protein [Oscillatoriaceae cyanobacterium Prado104]
MVWEPSQNWLGVIHQGASNNLVSCLTAPLSGQFGKIWENWWYAGDRAKKLQTKIGRELIN